MANPEQFHGNQERSGEVKKEAEQQAERLAKKFERSGEIVDDSEARTSAERKIVEALFAKEQSSETKAGGEPGSGPVKRNPITKHEKARSYKQTMHQIQNEMTPAGRVFSKVIHNPTVERTSEIVGATIARPNAILAGSFTAFLGVLVIYWLARTIGFTLSGFETIGAFIVGWVVGILFDFVRGMIT